MSVGGGCSSTSGGRASQPIFDAEAPHYRLAVAGELRAIVEDAAAGNPWRQRFAAVLTGHFNRRRYDLTELSPRLWLRNLPSAEALGPALACFLDDGSPPVARFEAFLRAAAEQQPKLMAPADELAEPDPDRAAALVVGSLLAFGCDPERVPVIRADGWNLVEQTLGLDHLPVFAGRGVRAPSAVCRGGAAPPARRRGGGARHARHADLIHMAAMQADFWVADRRHGSRGIARASRSEGLPVDLRDLPRRGAEPREWVEFHRLVGVERFFLYNNFSEDNHMEVLAPYIEEGS